MAPAGSGIPRGASGRGGSWSRRGSSSSILSTASPARVITSSTPSTGRWRPAFRQQRRQRYFHTDNLGPVAVIADENGAVVERDGYDAWGKRRLPTGADGAPAPSQTTTRGFTGQEELDFGLVHLNGRVYDPLVGRMMSADPYVPDPLNGQAWNRYAYVINNPLAFTDPSGYCFLGMCTWGHAISTFFDRSFGVLFRDVPILGTLFEIAAVGLCTLVAGPNPVCAAAAFGSTTFVTGVASGNLGYALRAGLIAGVTALLNYGVGDITKGLGDQGFLLNAAGRAAIGCASAAASGGKCGPGALAGGVTALAAPVTNGHGFIADLVMNSTVGGLASVAGGGKFANGAVTGAFGYLFSPQAGQQASPEVNEDISQAHGEAGDYHQRGYDHWYPDRDIASSDPLGWVDYAAPGGTALRVLYSTLIYFFGPNTTGLPPDGVTPPGEGPFTIGPASRRSEPGLSLWDSNGGEWRYAPEDAFHNPHWDYNPWNHATDKWQNIPIDSLPPRKLP